MLPGRYCDPDVGHRFQLLPAGDVGRQILFRDIAELHLELVLLLQSPQVDDHVLESLVAILSILAQRLGHNALQLWWYFRCVPGQWPRALLNDRDDDLARVVPSKGAGP
jgi:hypothetical protein